LILLDGFWAGQEDMIVENELVTAVYGPDMLASLEKAACQARRQTLYHLKVNTGMSRLGVEPAEVAAFFRAQSKYSWTRCDGIYTHLSSADDGESHSTGEQLGRFGEVLAEAQASGVQLRWRHAANSAGILNFKESWFDGVRPGLVLYGVNPLSKPLAHLKLEPVLSFKTRVMQIRQVKRGGSVGYGDTYSAPRDSLIATLPIGYADGLARSLSNRGVVLVRGNKAPIAGRISMDLTTVDVTSVPGVAVNDEVVLIGEQGENSIRVEEVARLAGTIPYELLCCIGRRVPPVYV
jgi:alanine racemase